MKIIIATDLDRESEAISWHLQNVLKLSKKPIEKITFHEITKNAVLEALNHPRVVNQNIFDAQQARRFLDRLVGYTLSPLIWENTLWNFCWTCTKSSSQAYRRSRERKAGI